jgi:hypothetical protein
MSVYDPYYGRYSGYGMYRAPSTRSYYSYAAPSPYSTYTDPTSDYYSRSMTGAGGAISQRIYFSLNGKLIRSYKIRNYRVRRFTSIRAGSTSTTVVLTFCQIKIQRAQKHVLKLYPDLLQGIASSRIQFYVTRPGYSHGRYVGFKAYISKHMWANEVDSLAEHETVGIEVRPSISFTESISSFFNRSPFY